VTVLTLFAFERDGQWLKRLKAGRGVLLAALIVLPWLALITWKSGAAFWQEAVGKDMLGKVAEGQESHGLPPGFYALTYSLFLWPFGLAALGAGLQALNRVREDAALRFCLAWYIPFWLLFELIPTKLPHYVLPAYPALALLIGWLATLEPADAEKPLRRWQVWLRRAAAFGQIVVTLGLAALCVGLPIHLTGRLDPWSIPAAVAVLAAGWLAFPRGLLMPLPRIGAAAAAAGIAFSLLFGTIAPRLTPIWLSPRIVQAVKDNKPCDTTVLASVGYAEPSLVFLAGTKTLLTDLDGAAKHLLSDPACAFASVPVDQEARLNDALAKAGKQAKRLAEIDGVNYSTGKTMALGLYRVAN
jgi:4-amino-4-deoxy-L-arabinose transferase-like glycosyltransferase